MDQTSNLQKTPHILPSQENYKMFIAGTIKENLSIKHNIEYSAAVIVHRPDFKLSKTARTSSPVFCDAYSAVPL